MEILKKKEKWNNKEETKERKMYNNVWEKNRVGWWGDRGTMNRKEIA
jgi:hypothetical protein